MQFEVYHTKNITINVRLVLPTAQEKYKPRRNDYTHVATVDCESLDGAFALTNHIDCEWWFNPQVLRHTESRSTSTGDIIKDPAGRLYLVASVGFIDKGKTWN